MSEEKIYAALAAINLEIGAIGKDRKTDSKNGGPSFNFRGIDDVMNELHSLFANNKVFVLTNAVGSPIVEARQTSGGKIAELLKQLWSFRFVSGEDGSGVDASAWGEAYDTSDKAMNKSASIALKYVLLQTFLIPTKEEKDPDAKSDELYQVQPSPEEAAMIRRAEELEAECDSFETKEQFSSRKKQLEEEFRGHTPVCLLNAMSVSFARKFPKEKK